VTESARMLLSTWAEPIGVRLSCNPGWGNHEHHRGVRKYEARLWIARADEKRASCTVIWCPAMFKNATYIGLGVGFNRKGFARLYFSLGGKGRIWCILDVCGRLLQQSSATTCQPILPWRDTGGNGVNWTILGL